MQNYVAVDGLVRVPLHRALPIQTAQRDTHASEQFLDRERLHQVIVRSGIKHFHFVGILQTRR